MPKLFASNGIIMIALLAVLLFNGISYFVYHGVFAKKSDSYESHLVYNYLKANDLPDLYFERFRNINSNWPPSRSEFAELFFDANRYVSERDHIAK